MKIIKTRYFTEFSGSLKIFLPNPANSGILSVFRIRSSVGRVSVSEAEGRWFEPSRVRQIISNIQYIRLFTVQHWCNELFFLHKKTAQIQVICLEFVQYFRNRPNLPCYIVYSASLGKFHAVLAIHLNVNQ